MGGRKTLATAKPSVVIASAARRVAIQQNKISSGWPKKKQRRSAPRHDVALFWVILLLEKSLWV
jgi:hypothetical protein